MLLRLGFNHAQSTLLLLAVNLVFIATAFSLDFLGDNLLIPIVALMAILFSLILNYLGRKRVLMREFDARGSWLEVNKSSRKAS